jgi:hypothetical protein
VNFISQEDDNKKGEEDSLHSPFEDDSEGAFCYSSEDAEGGRASSSVFNIGKCPRNHPYCPQC